MSEFDEGQPVEIDDSISEAPEQMEEELSEDPEIEQEDSDAESEDSDADQEDDIESEESDADQEDDSEEVDFRGSKYRLPKDAAHGVREIQKDYTQKTMALAEQRKAFEAQAKFQQENWQESARVAALDERLAEFNQVDWNRLSDDDPVLWQKLFAQRSVLEGQRNQLAAQVAQKQQQMHLQQQQEFAQQIEASETVLKREIKEWSPQLESSLQQFAVDKFGFGMEEVKASKANPQLYKLLHLAYVGEQLLKKQVAKPSPQVAKPVTVLKSGKGSAKVDPSKMSFAEYQKWRRQGGR